MRTSVFDNGVNLAEGDIPTGCGYGNDRGDGLVSMQHHEAY